MVVCMTGADRTGRLSTVFARSLCTRGGGACWVSASSIGEISMITLSAGPSPTNGQSLCGVSGSIYASKLVKYDISSLSSEAWVRLNSGVGGDSVEGGW